MTSPPREITVTCPGCGHVCEDWYRPSTNLSLNNFDDDYLKEASTTTCPECGGSMIWGRCSRGGIVMGGRLSRCE